MPPPAPPHHRQGRPRLCFTPPSPNKSGEQVEGGRAAPAPRWLGGEGGSRRLRPAPGQGRPALAVPGGGGPRRAGRGAERRGAALPARAPCLRGGWGGGAERRRAKRRGYGAGGSRATWRAGQGAAAAGAEGGACSRPFPPPRPASTTCGAGGAPACAVPGPPASLSRRDPLAAAGGQAGPG